ncbi:MAG: hypothetical protein AMK70_11195, partial [Nitrospira bacterium SG8_35_1]
MSRTVAILLLILTVPGSIMADNAVVRMGECEILIDDFADGIDPRWRSKSFKGTTKYTWTREGDRAFIRANSSGTASGLYYKIEYDAQQYPYITWQWKVDNIIAGGDATSKSGDDYGARVYVVFPAFFFWNTRAINYIWANKLPKEEMIPNSYAANSIMVSVESGRAETGKWITETRNIYEDYRRIFDSDPP